MKTSERNKGEAAREYAYRVLRDNIVSFDLKPGSTASVYELSEQLGISRTPVREALLELNRAGIVEVYPQRGNVISYVDFDRANEARFLRMALEQAVVELLCDEATETDLSELELCVRMQRLLLQDPFLQDPLSRSPYEGKQLELDNEFHEMLFRIAGKERLAHINDTLLIHFDRIRKLSLTQRSYDRVIAEHQEILDAVRNRDKGRARGAVACHLSGYSEEEQRQIRERYPEYFAEK